MRNYGPINYIDHLRSQSLHSGKLVAIRGQQRIPLTSQQYNVKQHHESAFRHRRLQELLDIEAQNDALLKRIITINRRKSQSVPNLHLPSVNRARAERMSMINSENNQIARKLVQCKPGLPAVELQKSYDVYLQRMRQLQKFQVSPEGKVRNKSLLIAESLMAKNSGRLSEPLK